MRLHRLAAGVATALSIALVAACSSSAGTGGHAAAPTPSAVPLLRRTDAGYAVPKLADHGQPGDVMAMRDDGPDAAVGGARRRVVLYRSSNANGLPRLVTAAVFVPPGRAPRGGFPVVAWAHGTTGIADRCAPSLHPNLFYDEYARLASGWLAAGYAVVATDYIGLGTPGTHSYLVGTDEGTAMVDSVVAAHHLGLPLARRWFAIGHSQGGQAVLFAARTAAHRAPSLPLAGTVAMAPAAGLRYILPAVLAGDDSDLSYAVYALIGLSTVDRRVDLNRLLGPVGRRRLPDVLRRRCLDETDADFTSHAPRDTLRLSSAEEHRLSAELDRYGDPDRARVDGPVLVIQGTADTDVPAAVTALAVSRLRKLGSDVHERTYPGLGHDQVVGASSCDVLAWLARHGGRPAGTCKPFPS